MAECTLDKNAILRMWRQIIEQTGIDKHTSEQWQVQYQDFCKCMISPSDPYVAIQSVEGLLRNAGIPLQAPYVQAASASATAKPAGAKAKKPEVNKELLEQQRAKQQQIYEQVHQQQQEQLKRYDKENVPILLQKSVNATRKLQAQSNLEQESTQNNSKMQGLQNYRIPRKNQDKPLPSSLIDALNGSNYSQKFEKNANGSGKEQEKNKKSYNQSALEMDDMQGAMGGSTQPESDKQQKYDKTGEKGTWYKKNFNEKTSTVVNHEVSYTSAGEGNTSAAQGTVNSNGLPDNNQGTTKKESRKKKKNKSKKRDD